MTYKIQEHTNDTILHDYFKTQDLHSFMHSPTWAHFKKKSGEQWSNIFLTWHAEDNTIVGAAAIHIRSLPLLRRTMWYIPRGIVTNYSDKEHIQYITKSLKDFAKKKKAAFVKIDPFIVRYHRDVLGKRIESDSAFSNEYITEHLEHAGFHHCGYNDDMTSTIQGRYTFVLDLKPSEKDILASFKQKTRYNINLAQKKGVEIVTGTYEDIDTFFNLMQVTGIRDGIQVRNAEYYKTLYKTLHPTKEMELYLARINTERALSNAEQALSDFANQKEALEVKLQDETLSDKVRKKAENEYQRLCSQEKKKKSDVVEAKALFEQSPEGIILSGAIMMHYNTTSAYLFGASDDNYRNFQPNALIQWHMICEAKKRGATHYDFVGFDGSLDESSPNYGLYRFKSGFNPAFCELLGEFDAIIHKPSYHFFQFMKYVNKQRKRIKNKK